MDRTIAHLNIERYRRMLAEEEAKLTAPDRPDGQRRET